MEDAAERAAVMHMTRKQHMQRMHQHLSEGSERGNVTRRLSSRQRAANSNTGENPRTSGNAFEATPIFDDVGQCGLASHRSSMLSNNNADDLQDDDGPNNCDNEPHFKNEIYEKMSK